MQREQTSEKFPFGSSIPAFSLPATDGRTITENYLSNAKAALVVFSCNHCPYVKGSEEALLKTIAEFNSKGLKSVIISSNDAAQYPEDGFEKMKENAASWKEKYPALELPYLYDESQTVARTFDAACTPECYLFVDGKLAFHGAPNSNPKDPAAPRAEFLRTALENVFAGAPIKAPYCHPIGCSIKWKS